MKTFKLFTYCAFVLLAMNLISCGDDSPGGVDCDSSLAVNQEIGDEVDAISTAVTAYANDPSPANCNKLEEAYQDYIDALKELQDCADQAGVGDEFAQSLIDAENNIGNLGC